MQIQRKRTLSMQKRATRSIIASAFVLARGKAPDDDENTAAPENAHYTGSHCPSHHFPRPRHRQRPERLLPVGVVLLWLLCHDSS